MGGWGSAKPHLYTDPLPPDTDPPLDADSHGCRLPPMQNPPHPVDRMTAICKNIILSQTSFVGGKNGKIEISRLNVTLVSQWERTFKPISYFQSYFTPSQRQKNSIIQRKTISTENTSHSRPCDSRNPEPYNLKRKFITITVTQ